MPPHSSAGTTSPPIHESLPVLVPICLASLAVCIYSPPGSPVLSFSASLMLVASLHFCIRKLKMDATAATAAAAATSAATAATRAATTSTSSIDANASALCPDEWREFPLESVTPVSPDSSIYKFRLPTPHHLLGIAVGQHISVRMLADGGSKEVSRSYTPISDPDTRGHFCLLVKTYLEGNVSRHIRDLAIGSMLSVKGPKGKFIYTPNMARVICLVAGGTGIAPIYQVVRAVLESDKAVDATRLLLMYGSRTEGDILLRKELDAYAVTHADRFKMHHVLSEVDANDKSWTGLRGHMTKALLSEHLEPPAKDVRVLICGPPPMNKAVLASLEELGYGAVGKTVDDSLVFKF